MKNSILAIVIMISVAVVFSSCANSQNGETKTNITEINVGKKQIALLIDGYLDIKDALVNTDEVTARKSASQLLEQINDSQNVSLKKIQIDVKHISESESIKSQRDYFNTLSDNIYTLLKEESNEKKLYRQYCPMAFNNDGAYWLSAEKEINNPYFGDRMLHCGIVKEEL